MCIQKESQTYIQQVKTLYTVVCSAVPVKAVDSLVGPALKSSATKAISYLDKLIMSNM